MNRAQYDAFAIQVHQSIKAKIAAKTHTVPNQVTIRAVEMPVTHRIVHCAIASRNGAELAYYPAEWHYREPGISRIPSISEVQIDARWSVAK